MQVSLSLSVSVCYALSSPEMQLIFRQQTLNIVANTVAYQCVLNKSFYIENMICKIYK